MNKKKYDEGVQAGRIAAREGRDPPNLLTTPSYAEGHSHGRIEEKKDMALEQARQKERESRS